VSLGHRKKEGTAVENGSDSESLLREVLERYEETYTGYGGTLEEAHQDAYEKGKSAGHRVFHVRAVFIRGDNPLSGYAVVVSPTG
jgi:hypothetical protein